MISELFNYMCSLNITSDGWLGFWGEIIGATATIIAVIATIKYEKSKELRERVMTAKPWITSDIELISNKKRLDSLINNNILYVYKIGNTFGSSKIKPLYFENEDYKFNKKQCIVRYTFSNNGGNTATSLNIQINNQIVLPPFCLATNKDQNWILILPGSESSHEINYTLTFEYGDIVSNTKYIQKETLVIKNSKDKVTLTQKDNELITAPHEYNKKKHIIL